MAGKDVQSIHLKRLHGRLGEIVYQLTQVRLSPVCPPQTWSPAVNAYLCEAQIVICVDLAGVQGESLELRVQRNRLSIRGRREPPEPAGRDAKALQILAMEIDYGPFCREIELPSEVNPQAVRAQQANGLIWIHLPLRSPA